MRGETKERKKTRNGRTSNEGCSEKEKGEKNIIVIIILYCIYVCRLCLYIFSLICIWLYLCCNLQIIRTLQKSGEGRGKEGLLPIL